MYKSKATNQLLHITQLFHVMHITTAVKTTIVTFMIQLSWGEGSWVAELAAEDNVSYKLVSLLRSAEDALSLTEFELMELLDVGLSDVKSALAHISEIVSPPYQTALLLMEQRVRNEQLGGHLPTRLKGLDAALCGGIPFSVLTEVVGPAGIGKTQFCLKLSLLASLPAHYGGLDGRVIYIDVESKFSSRRSLAEFSRIPVVVTNQVRSQNRDESCPYSFQVQDKGKTKEDSTRYESHLVAALGIHWAHAVTIRLVLEAKSGQRFIKVAKSPISPPLAFPFIITSSGISLLTDDGTELIGPEINTICCQGRSGRLAYGYCAEQFGMDITTYGIFEYSSSQSLLAKNAVVFRFACLVTGNLIRRLWSDRSLPSDFVNFECFVEAVVESNSE
ncbi:hypothetical protein LWI29_006455 [Acer saccharum]|uniref:RecA family profile 1 domain-containing protein n=1 Tax=Acer saccharum TaxID=4024 RepID=A0AA39VYV6_ACESA|nr:hypothetical protein LWI29_006455 [Acer saccharum]